MVLCLLLIFCLQQLSLIIANKNRIFINCPMSNFTLIQSF